VVRHAEGVIKLSWYVTPKVFANFSPGLAQPRERKSEPALTLKALANWPAILANAFSVANARVYSSQGCRSAPTAGLQLANAFGVVTCMKLNRDHA
jgi:predicted outer membrane lipoprotein